MKILVVDVAAEYGGAETILKQFVEEFENDGNEYVFILGKLQYNNIANIRFISARWVKKSWINRLFFELFFIKRIITKENPDKIISLQNTAVRCKDHYQEVYFHNILLISEKKYSFKESRFIWAYQKIISKITRNSLKFADNIIVQADWIKKTLIKKWNINENHIRVKKPRQDLFYAGNRSKILNECRLFYPAQLLIYKNHKTLLLACKKNWDAKGTKCGLTLYLTCNKSEFEEKFPLFSTDLYPIFCLGNLNKTEMRNYYLSSILVFPSYIETIGLPLMEAAQSGCDIIVSDLDYSHESLGEYKKALFFNPDSVDELSILIDNKLKSGEII